MQNKKVVWSLFDGSGIMGLPWATAGYQVYCFNADSGNHGEYKIKMEHENLHYVDMWIDEKFTYNMSFRHDIPAPSIVFGFPDCTMFAHSGAQHERTDEELNYALQMAKAVKATGESYGVPWMIENPVGKLSNPNMMGKPDFYFHPRDFGGYVAPHEETYHPKMPHCDNYTKKTCIWCGNGFKKPQPLAVPEGVEGVNFFWGWKFLGGKSSKTKQLRSLTPRGFARAVFQANHK